MPGRARNDEAGCLASEAAALKEESSGTADRANRAETALQSAEQQILRLTQQNTQIQHQCRSQERVVEKLKAKLADKVSREEKRVNRDKEVYDRLKRAQSISKRSVNGKAGTGRNSCETLP